MTDARAGGEGGRRAAYFTGGNGGEPPAPTTGTTSTTRVASTVRVTGEQQPGFPEYQRQLEASGSHTLIDATLKSSSMHPESKSRRLREVRLGKWWQKVEPDGEKDRKRSTTPW